MGEEARECVQKCRSEMWPYARGVAVWVGKDVWVFARDVMQVEESRWSSIGWEGCWGRHERSSASCQLHGVKICQGGCMKVRV